MTTEPAAPPAPDDDIVLPDDERERYAVLRVLHHLLAHLLGVEQRLSPDTYRSPYLDELTGVPNFAADRKLAEQLLQQFPAAKALAWTNRAFLRRAAGYAIGAFAAPRTPLAHEHHLAPSV